MFFRCCRTCTQSQECTDGEDGVNGTCQVFQLSSEEEMTSYIASSLTCENPECSCVIPCMTSSTECEMNGGTCYSAEVQCPQGYNVDNSPCTSQHCQCCIPCLTEGTLCEMNGGTCFSNAMQCPSGFTSVSYECTSDSCQCCIKGTVHFTF